MTSLTEAYEGNTREVTSLRRLYAGTGLVVLGAVLSVVAVLLATTDLFSGVATVIADPYGSIESSATGGVEHYTSVRIAGVLAGLGVPAALVGVFLVLPAGRWVRAAGAISASLCAFGVTLFWYAYPLHWRGVGEDLTLQVSAVYLLGLFIAVWCLFTAVVNFKTRNDPGGMLEMNVTRRNQTILEVSESDSEATGFGGIGFLGGTPDVETQTNGPDESVATTPDRTDDATVLDDGNTTGTDVERTTGTERSGVSSGRTDAGTTTDSGSTSFDRPGGAATSDGGSVSTDITSPLDEPSGGSDDGVEIVDSSPASPSSPAGPTDRYCGNCRHFEYVRSSSGIVPYCAHHDRAMDDMDACGEWTPNRP